MRYDTPVFFCRRGEMTYDADTGDYIEGKPSEDKRLASVMDTRQETMQLVYGEIRQDSLTVQIQNHYKRVVDYVRIGDKKYRVDYQRKLRFKHTFILSEEQL